VNGNRWCSHSDVNGMARANAQRVEQVGDGTLGLDEVDLGVGHDVEVRGAPGPFVVIGGGVNIEVEVVRFHLHSLPGF